MLPAQAEEVSKDIAACHGMAERSTMTYEAAPFKDAKGQHSNCPAWSDPYHGVL